MDIVAYLLGPGGSILVKGRPISARAEGHYGAVTVYVEESNDARECMVTAVAEHGNVQHDWHHIETVLTGDGWTTHIYALELPTKN